MKTVWIFSFILSIQFNLLAENSLKEIISGSDEGQSDSIKSDNIETVNFGHAPRVSNASERLAVHYGLKVDDQSVQEDIHKSGTYFRFYEIGDWGVLRPRKDSSFRYGEKHYQFDPYLDSNGSLSEEAYWSLEQKVGEIRKAEEFGGPKLLGLSILSEYHIKTLGIRVAKAPGEVVTTLNRFIREAGDPAPVKKYVSFISNTLAKNILPLDAHMGNFFLNGDHIVPFDVVFRRPEDLPPPTAENTYSTMYRKDQWNGTVSTLRRARLILFLADDRAGVKSCDVLIGRLTELFPYAHYVP